MNKQHQIILGLVAIVLLAGGLAGGYAWGKSQSPQGDAQSIGLIASHANATDHNDADVSFLQAMTSHHEQAISMAALAAGRAELPEVKTLAKQIEEAQQPEIDRMHSWLSAWHAPTTMTSMSMHGMDHGHMGSGMMSDEDLSDLKAKSGKAFDAAFLTMMREHHAGAISMAADETRDGKNADTLALAASIQISQKAESAYMKSLLAD